MHSFIYNNDLYRFELSGKLSINSMFDAFNIYLNDELVSFKDISFTSGTEEIFENILNGHFEIKSNKIDENNSIILQKLYIECESKFKDRAFINFRLSGSPNSQGGFARGLTGFHALINCLAREFYGFDLISFATYLSIDELRFIQEYCSFHPRIREHIIKKNNTKNNLVVIPTAQLNILIKAALSHVRGYRDFLRLSPMLEKKNISDGFYDSGIYANGLTVSNKFLIDSETFNFNNGEMSGGLLDILSLPFDDYI